MIGIKNIKKGIDTMRSVGILTLGCKVNTYESEFITNVLKENNLVMNIEDIESIDKENTIVKLQVPSSGVVVNSGSNVYLEY